MLTIKHYLTRMDDELLVRDGSAELSHEEAKQALRDVYLISCGEKPEFHPSRTADLGGTGKGPAEIWAFYAPEIAESESGATVVAHENCQHGSQRYVRADLHDKLEKQYRAACAVT